MQPLTNVKKTIGSMRALGREPYRRAAETVADFWGVKPPSAYFHLLLEGFRYGGPFPLGAIREMRSLRDQERDQAKE